MAAPVCGEGNCEICGKPVFHRLKSPPTRWCGYLCRNLAYRRRRNPDPPWPPEAVAKIAIDWLLIEGFDRPEIERVTGLSHSTVYRRVRVLASMEEAAE